MDGGDGNDFLIDPEGNDTMLGGEGNDSMSALQGDDIVDGGSGWDFLMGSEGADTLVAGTGADLLIGGDGADLIDLSEDAYVPESDNVDISLTSEFGDLILAFNTDALPVIGSIIGGDSLDLQDLLPTVSTFADAIAGGYLSFGGNANSTTLSIDVDGAAGPEVAQAVCRFDGIAFVDSATSETQFADNIIV